MPVLFRCTFKTARLSRFLKVAMVISNFMREINNGGFSPEFNVSMLKETIALVQDYA